MGLREWLSVTGLDPSAVHREPLVVRRGKLVLKLVGRLAPLAGALSCAKATPLCAGNI